VGGEGGAEGSGVLRKTFGLERDEVAENGEDCIMRSSMLCTAELILFELSSQKVHGEQGM
jgi:hypothetical protein